MLSAEEIFEREKAKEGYKRYLSDPQEFLAIARVGYNVYFYRMGDGRFFNHAALGGIVFHNVSARQILNLN